MRVTSAIEKPLLFLGALAVNLGLYLLVPYIQALILKHAGGPARGPKQVTTVLEFAPPPAERLVKREIKEIKTQAFTQLQPTPNRPSTPGGGLKIDLSPAGGEGLALVSGGDRTGGIGSGTGGGQGNGMAAMTYNQGETDIDAKTLNNPQLNYPPRAEREGVAGFADLTFVVNEAGMVEQITVMKEEPEGYGFGAAAVESTRKMHFKPAQLQKMPVRQRFKKRFNFTQQQ